MEPNPLAITFETPLAKCWLEAKTLCIVSNNVPRTTKNLEEHYKIVKGIVKKRVYWILDFKTCQDYGEDVKSLIGHELPDICECLAIIAETSCEKILAETFLKFKALGIPVRICESEQEARIWLRRLDGLKRKQQV